MMSSSTSSTRPSVSSRVDSTSVQSQFAALSRSRDALRQQLHQIEGERRRHEASINQLKQRSTSLSTQHHVLHESLGKHRMKKALLIKEKTRLSTLFKSERQQLETIGDVIQEMAEASTQSKLSFCKQLQQISLSMESLIQKHEDRHWSALLRDEKGAEVLQNFAASRGGHDFEANEEWLSAAKRLQEYHELHADMMTELSAFRDQAKRAEPVRMSYAWLS
jgi:chromosome segregation ATPase